MSIAALILAAGSSNRMGRPKELLEYRGKTFLENIINAARVAAVDDIVVAVSRYDGKIKEVLDLCAVEVVKNAELETAGPLGSIRAGLRLLINRSVEYLLVWPVDQPQVRPSTVSQLCRTSIEARAKIAVPRFGERRGHPVLFARSVFQELIDAPDHQGARQVVRREPGRVLEVSVDDPGVVDDIDTPEDYERLISSTNSLL